MEHACVTRKGENWYQSKVFRRLNKEESWLYPKTAHYYRDLDCSSLIHQNWQNLHGGNGESELRQYKNEKYQLTFPQRLDILERPHIVGTLQVHHSDNTFQPLGELGRVFHFRDNSPEFDLDAARLGTFCFIRFDA